MQSNVTPCVGVWIETESNTWDSNLVESHPAWVCGLKPYFLNKLKKEKVTPCVGVWIETLCKYKNNILICVTPCVGVWIETFESL